MRIRYSILVPVKNSIKTLPYTLETCLRQEEIQDYEVVVGDNGSTEDVKSVVDSFNNPRLVYYRNDEGSTQADSFNFILSKAKGEYVFMLGADDSISRWALYIADRILAITGEDILWWNPSRYFWPERKDFPNSLWMPENRNYKWQNSEEKLGDFFRLTHSWDLPLLYQHCVIKRSLLNEISEDLSQYELELHEPPMADNFQGVMTLLYTKRFVEIPYGLIVMGQSYSGDSHKEKEGSAKQNKNYISNQNVNRIKDEPFYTEGRLWHSFWLYHAMITAKTILEKKGIDNNYIIPYKNLVANTVHELLYQYECSILEGQEYGEMFNDTIKYLQNSINKLNDNELTNWFESAYGDLMNYDASVLNKDIIRKKLDTNPNHVIRCDNFSIRNISQAQELIDNIYYSKSGIDNDMKMLSYSFKKTQKLISEIKELDQKGSIAIYGSGSAADLILNTFFDFENDFKNPIYILDSDENKRGDFFRGYEIYNPKDIPSMGIVGVVISSMEFQNAMYGNLVPYINELKVIKPYDIGDIQYLELIGNKQNKVVHI
ncbi:MAG: glycosyltransferase family 2 protein [Lachnospiraceae bacterium]|nr:glycosyltransferase family 2 protein [Lachnospiraceae bacterium]